MIMFLSCLAPQPLANHKKNNYGSSSWKKPGPKYMGPTNRLKQAFQKRPYMISLVRPLREFLSKENLPNLMNSGNIY